MLVTKATILKIQKLKIQKPTWPGMYSVWLAQPGSLLRSRLSEQRSMLLALLSKLLVLLNGVRKFK
jgi:hypothetical protein